MSNDDQRVGFKWKSSFHSRPGWLNARAKLAETGATTRAQLLLTSTFAAFATPADTLFDREKKRRGIVMFPARRQQAGHPDERRQSPLPGLILSFACSRSAPHVPRSVSRALAGSRRPLHYIVLVDKCTYRYIVRTA